MSVGTNTLPVFAEVWENKKQFTVNKRRPKKLVMFKENMIFPQAAINPIHYSPNRSTLMQFISALQTLFSNANE